MRRIAGGFLAAILAFSLLLSSAPQEGRKSEEHSMLQTQLHTLALEENGQGRWQCEVRLRGQKAHGVARSAECVLTATWKNCDGWVLERVVCRRL